MDITIFDYEVTLEELKYLFVKYMTKKEYVENTTYKKRLQDLYGLFKMRGDRVRAGGTLHNLTSRKGFNIAS